MGKRKQAGKEMKRYFQREKMVSEIKILLDMIKFRSQQEMKQI